MTVFDEGEQGQLLSMTTYCNRNDCSLRIPVMTLVNCERKALIIRKARCVIGAANIVQLIKERGSIGLIEN